MVYGRVDDELLVAKAQTLPLLVLALTDETVVELLHLVLRYLLDPAAVLLPLSPADQVLVGLLATRRPLRALILRPELQQPKAVPCQHSSRRYQKGQRYLQLFTTNSAYLLSNS